MLYNKIVHNMVTAEVNDNINRMFENNGWNDELRDIFLDNVMIDIIGGINNITGLCGEAILTNPYDFQLEDLRHEGYVITFDSTWICVDGEDEVSYYRVTEPKYMATVMPPNYDKDEDDDDEVTPVRHGRKLRAPSREYTRTVNSLHPEIVPDRCSRRIKGIHNTRKHWKNEERRKLRHHNKDICKKVVIE